MEASENQQTTNDNITTFKDASMVMKTEVKKVKSIFMYG